MATILDFPEMHVAPRRRPVRRSKPTTAEIILFPGVRYERWHDTHGEHDPCQSTVVRDRLQLVE
jgi:hypothetical protein